MSHDLLLLFTFHANDLMENGLNNFLISFIKIRFEIRTTGGLSTSPEIDKGFFN